MAKFIVQQYELHKQDYEVEAADRAEAVVAVMRGEGTMVDNTQEFIEGAERYGRPIFTEEEQAKLKEAVLLDSDGVVPTIRNIEED